MFAFLLFRTKWGGGKLKGEERRRAIVTRSARSNDVVGKHKAHTYFFASPHQKHYNRRGAPRHTLLAMDQHTPMVQTVANEFYHLVCMRQEIARGGIVNWNPLVPNLTAAGVFKVVRYASRNSLLFGRSNIQDPTRPTENMWVRFISTRHKREKKWGGWVEIYIYLRTFLC